MKGDPLADWGVEEIRQTFDDESPESRSIWESIVRTSSTIQGMCKFWSYSPLLLQLIFRYFQAQKRTGPCGGMSFNPWSDFLVAPISLLPLVPPICIGTP